MNSQEVKKYLIETSKMIHGMKKSNWKYPNMFDFVAKEGKEFEERSPLLWPQGEMGDCFKNSTDLLIENPQLRYVEGYAFRVAFPMYHAWLIDDRDRIVDPTWDETSSGYFGVIFPAYYVRRTIVKSGEYSVIDKWKMRWPLLTGEDNYNEIMKKLMVEI